MGTISYRLALDLGSTSLGWAVLRLKGDEPVAIIKAGAHLQRWTQPQGWFFTGSYPTRRARHAPPPRPSAQAQAPHDDTAAQAWILSLPTPRAQGAGIAQPLRTARQGVLYEALRPPNSPVPCFTSTSDAASRATARQTRRTTTVARSKRPSALCAKQLDPSGANGKARTVGELLWWRFNANEEGQPLRAGLVRARYRERRIEKEDGKTRIDKSYDLYIDRAMIEAEFDTLWAKAERRLTQPFSPKRRAPNSRTACCINARSNPSSRAAARWNPRRTCSAGLAQPAAFSHLSGSQQPAHSE
jgi:CRISPR-associated endonuclease Csn1